MSDRYKILDQIGRGGMGVVHRARDQKLGRQVALKRLREDHLREEKLQERFRREARAVARLDHPHIVPVYDFGVEDGVPLLVMPFIEGPTLRERVAEEGPLSAEEVARIGKKLAEALGAAHEEGIVHRDVKSQNVLMDGDRPRLTDFGIARLREKTRLTSTNEVLGTPAYMSPEQLEGGDVDHRSDIYSLGVVLYECLAGHVPYQGESTMQVMYAIAEGDRKLLENVALDVPRWLSEVVERCLSVEPGRRDQSAVVLRKNLHRGEPGWKPFGTETAEMPTINEDIDPSEEAVLDGGILADGIPEVKPEESTRRKVRLALRRKNLYSIERGIERGNRGVARALAELIEEMDPVEQSDLLNYAVEGSRSHVAKTFLVAGTDPNAADDEGQAPLHHAAREGAKQAAEVLINQGADPSLSKVEPWGNRWVPLHEACSNGHTEVAKLLLSAGADPNVADEETGRTPLIQAAWMDCPEVAQLLLDAGADPNKSEKNCRDGHAPLHEAAKGGNVDVVRTLFESGADLNQENRIGQTPLHVAIREGGHLEVVQLLLDAGADPNWSDDLGWTPLHEAAVGGRVPEARSGTVQIATRLIDAGADVNRSGDEKDWTPLHCAAYMNHVAETQVLLEAGALQNVIDQSGATPLDVAEDKDHHAVAEVLRQHRKT